MQILSNPHPHATSCIFGPRSNPNPDRAPTVADASSYASASTTATISSSNVTSTAASQESLCSPPPTDELRQFCWKISPKYLSLYIYGRMGSREKGTVATGAPKSSNDDGTTQLLRYSPQLMYRIKISFVGRKRDAIILCNSVWSSSSLLMRRRSYTTAALCLLSVEKR